jgi:hypothetical protein
VTFRPGGCRRGCSRESRIHYRPLSIIVNQIITMPCPMTYLHRSFDQRFRTSFLGKFKRNFFQKSRDPPRFGFHKLAAFRRIHFVAVMLMIQAVVTDSGIAHHGSTAIIWVCARLLRTWCCTRE